MEFAENNSSEKVCVLIKMRVLQQFVVQSLPPSELDADYSGIPNMIAETQSTVGHITERGKQ